MRPATFGKLLLISISTALIQSFVLDSSTMPGVGYINLPLVLCATVWVLEPVRGPVASFVQGLCYDLLRFSLLGLTAVLNIGLGWAFHRVGQNPLRSRAANIIIVVCCYSVAFEMLVRLVPTAIYAPAELSVVWLYNLAPTLFFGLVVNNLFALAAAPMVDALLGQRDARSRRERHFTVERNRKVSAFDSGRTALVLRRTSST